MRIYSIQHWYWVVADTNQATQVYSSASASFIDITDAGYAAFLADANLPTKIPTQADLIWVFQNATYTAGAAGLSSSN